MAIKKIAIGTLALAAVLLTASKCNRNSNVLNEVPETEFIDNCPDMLYDFGETVSVGDPDGRFNIQLPHRWDIRESYSDSVYGVFASNYLSVPKPMEDQMAISAFGYNIDDAFEDYVLDEMIALAEDENIQVLERGTSMFSGQSNPWVLFVLENTSFNMVYYIGNPEKSEVFIVQALSNDTVNYKVKHCYLKQLINSFLLGE